MLFLRKYGLYLVGLLTFCLYYPTISYDYNLDDYLVTQGQDFAEKGLPVSHYTSYGLDSLSRIFTEPYYQDNDGNSYGFRPITHVSFALEHEFFGESAGVSHTMNALLYALLSMMLALLLHRLFPQWDYVVVLLATLLFAVHPMHVEVVASIKNRDEILALLFFLLGWYLMLHYSKQPRLSILLGVLCFALSIYSKLSLLFMPGVIALYLLRHEKFSLSDVILYTAGTVGVAALRMEWSLELVLILLTVGLFLLYIFHVMWSQENRNLMAHQAKLLYQQFQLFRQTVQNKMPQSDSSTTWKHWSFISGLSLILVSILAGQYISPSFFYALCVAVVFTCLIFWVPIPYYMVLGLLGGIGLQMNFNGHNLILLPIVVRLFHSSNEENDPWDFRYLLTYLGPSMGLSALVLTASELWELRTIIYIVLIYAFPLWVFPISILIKRWTRKLPQIVLWITGIVFGLLITYKIATAHFYTDVLPIYIGLLLGLWPKTGFLDKSFQRIGMGSLLLLIMGFFFHIQPVMHNEGAKQFVQSGDGVSKGIGFNEDTANNDSISVSKLGRPLDISENPMVGVDDFSERVAFTFSNVYHYHRQMFLSAPWSAYYGYGAISGASWSSFEALVGLGLWILLLVILIMGWVRGHTSWWIGACVVWFGLLPFVNLFVLMAGGVADRYTFTASLGIVILLVGMLRQFKALKRQGIMVVLGLCIITLTWRCYDRIPSWESKESLYTSSLEQFPEAAKVHYLLADTRAGQAAVAWESSNKSRNAREIFRTSLDSALVSYTRAISLYPRAEWEEDRNGIYEDLIRLNLELGEDIRALELLQEYCTLNALNCAPRYLNLVKNFMDKGNFEASYQGFLLLIEAEPLASHFTQYSRNLSLYLSSDAGVKEILERTLEYGIDVYPNSAELYFNYGSLFMTYNDFSNALFYLNKAFEINPELNDLQRRIAICEDEKAPMERQ